MKSISVGILATCLLVASCGVPRGAEPETSQGKSTEKSLEKTPEKTQEISLQVSPKISSKLSFNNPKDPGTAKAVDVPTDAAMLSMLQTTCATCHHGANAPAHVVLDSISGASAAAAPAKDALNGDKMPPQGAAQPSADAKAEMLAWFNAHC